MWPRHNGSHATASQNLGPTDKAGFFRSVAEQLVDPRFERVFASTPDDTGSEARPPSFAGSVPGLPPILRSRPSSPSPVAGQRSWSRRPMNTPIDITAPCSTPTPSATWWGGASAPISNRPLRSRAAAAASSTRRSQCARCDVPADLRAAATVAQCRHLHSPTKRRYCELGIHTPLGREGRSGRSRRHCAKARAGRFVARPAGNWRHLVPPAGRQPETAGTTPSVQPKASIPFSSTG